MKHGVNVASLALMAVVPAHLGRAAMVDAVTVVLGLASAVVRVLGEKGASFGQ